MKTRDGDGLSILDILFLIVLVIIYIKVTLVRIIVPEIMNFCVWMSILAFP